MPRTKKNAVPFRGGRHRMVLELDPADMQLLDKLDERYRELVGSTQSNRVFVIRQLIRIASAWDKLPSIKVQ